MCPVNETSNLIIEDSIGDYDSEPIQEDNDEMVNLLKLLNKNVEENNKNNAKTQAITNKLLAAYEKMSHCIDSVLMRMEMLEKKVAHQEKSINSNINHNKEKINKAPRDFIKSFIPNKKHNGNTNENTHNAVNKPQENQTLNEKQPKQVGNYINATRSSSFTSYSQVQ
ncbi:hypothetical protein O181_030442 [Austropuccinia psidii MF-1]|uniref:Uncharacterized protein n=1 Tax=Austropuccinia psidii MF-1 TaxID=1389203 RepID=A0A9Q3CYN2_9BASI|nr:hypothetical protein [Austropuccinia psidii MF-1]